MRLMFKDPNSVYKLNHNFNISKFNRGNNVMLMAYVQNGVMWKPSKR